LKLFIIDLMQPLPPPLQRLNQPRGAGEFLSDPIMDFCREKPLLDDSRARDGQQRAQRPQFDGSSDMSDHSRIHRRLNCRRFHALRNEEKGASRLELQCHRQGESGLVRQFVVDDQQISGMDLLHCRRGDRPPRNPTIESCAFERCAETGV
jgi:hypothetical protein